MNFPRESGLLAHITSLPGPYGIGEIGAEARAFVDALGGMMGHVLWQVLPLGPTGYGDSPYQSLSTFAGNPLLIAFDELIKDGLLSPSRLREFPRFQEDCIDYGKVIPARMAVLQTVCRTFARRASSRHREGFVAFCEKEAYWLDDYALFVAIKDEQGGRPWPEWPEALARRDDQALHKAERAYKAAIRNVTILQYLFDDQWHRLRRYAHRKGVRLVGDIPLFVAHDSADVWAHPDLFYLEPDGRPTVVAGVPPDYFSKTGQLWGNPLYRWALHEERDYVWWVARMRKLFEMADIVRIDHFRGFESCWEVPGDAKTAIEGRWAPGPGERLFKTLLKELGPLPIIAEDLGVITPPVEALRDQFKFPGMRVLQFAFGNDDKADDYKPHNYPRNCVVYTGTHDNDTTIGWFHGEPGKNHTLTKGEIAAERQGILAYIGGDGSEIHWDLIKLALESRGNTVIVPIQDVMGLGSAARMNVPGSDGGNWQWRFTRERLTDEMKGRMFALNTAARRIPG